MHAETLCLCGAIAYSGGRCAACIADLFPKAAPPPRNRRGFAECYLCGEPVRTRALVEGACVRCRAAAVRRNRAHVRRGRT